MLSHVARSWALETAEMADTSQPLSLSSSGLKGRLFFRESAAAIAVLCSTLEVSSGALMRVDLEHDRSPFLFRPKGNQR